MRSERISPLSGILSYCLPFGESWQRLFYRKNGYRECGREIGDNVVINTMALVEHGSSVESHANISTKAVLNGDVLIGEGTFVGSGSVVIGQLSVEAGQ